MGLMCHRYIDIVANIGRFLLNLFSIERSRSYVGVEPLPLPAAAYVRRIIVENSLSTHSTIAVALGDIRFRSG